MVKEKKWSKNLKRYFSQENVQIRYNYVFEKVLSITNHQGMQIKPIMRYLETFGMVIIKKLKK